MTDSDSIDQAALAIRFWGVRGSIGVCGPQFTEFGGNTSCMEILAGGRRIIVDAGSGIAALGQTLQAKAGDRFTILLTHLHHDHVLGLMAFAPCFVKGVEIEIHCGNLGGATAEDALRRLFSPPLFPVTFDDLPANVSFRGFTAGDTISVEGLAIQTIPLNHPDGAAGYRFEHDGGAIAVLTDMEHAGSEPDSRLVTFARGADILVYDATFDVPDYPAFRGWGHSTWEAGATLAEASGAAALVCFHHAPEYDDARLRRMEAELKAVLPSGFFAREGQIVGCPASRLADRAPDAR